MYRVGSKTVSSGRSSHGHGSWWLAGLAVLALAPHLAQAQEDPGGFDVRSASIGLESGVYYLDTWIEYRLSSDAREALEAAVPLTVQLEVEFINSRWFWGGENVGNLRQSYQLQYHSLSERYIVRNLNSGEQSTFATLFSALNDLGRVTRLPLIDAALLDPNQNHDVRIRALLSTEDMPGPLRFLAFWRRDVAQSSGWDRWQLED